MKWVLNDNKQFQDLKQQDNMSQLSLCVWST